MDGSLAYIHAQYIRKFEPCLTQVASQSSTFTASTLLSLRSMSLPASQYVDEVCPSLPPSITIVLPLQYAPAFETMYSTVPAISFSSPIRPSGTATLSTGITPEAFGSLPMAWIMGADISLGNRPGARTFALDKPSAKLFCPFFDKTRGKSYSPNTPSGQKHS